jgi:tetratricopeptide (TPR) repeat protein
LNALAAESEGNAALQTDLAQGYYKLGELPNKNLAQAEQNYQKGIAIHQNLLAADSHNLEYQKGLTIGWRKISNLRAVGGDLSAANDYLQKSIDILKTVVANEPNNLDYQKTLNDTEQDAFSVLFLLGKVREAARLNQKISALGERLFQSGAVTDEYERQFLISPFNEAKCLIFFGDYRRAIALLNVELERIETEAVNSNDTRYQYSLWAHRRALATALERQGQTRAKNRSAEFKPAPAFAGFKSCSTKIRILYKLNFCWKLSQNSKIKFRSSAFGRHFPRAKSYARA